MLLSWHDVLEVLGCDSRLGAWLFVFMWVNFAIMFIAWAVRVADAETPPVVVPLARLAPVPAELDDESGWEVLA